MLIEDG